MNAKLMTAAALLALSAAGSPAAGSYTPDAVRAYRQSVNGRVTTGVLVVNNDYTRDANGRVTLELWHPDVRGRDFGHWPLDGGYRGPLSHESKELVVGLDWGVRVIFGNGVKSEVRMLRDVASPGKGRIYLKMTAVNQGTRPAAASVDPNRRITATHNFYFHATKESIRGKPFTDGWTAPDGFVVVDARVEAGTRRKVKGTYLTVSRNKTSVSIGGVYDSLWIESTGSLYDGKVIITFERR